MKYYTTVNPIPTVNLTAPNTQIVGQSLTLECSVTTVSGITSRVDIVWRRNGLISHVREGVSISTTFKDSLLYTDLHNITQLNTKDDGTIYQCEVVINTSPEIIATSRLVILDIIGMYNVLNSASTCIHMHKLIPYHKLLIKCTF